MIPTPIRIQTTTVQATKTNSWGSILLLCRDLISIMIISNILATLLFSLGALVLPANFVVEMFSRRVSERFIMKLAIWFIIFACFGIINYQGLYYDVLLGISEYKGFDPIDLVHLKELEISGEEVGKFMTKDNEFPYDWNSGQAVYMTFLSAIFGGTIVLEGLLKV